MPSWVMILINFVLRGFGLGGSSKSDIQAAQEQGVAQGTAQATAAASQGELQDVGIAKAERETVRDSAARDPGGVMSDDGFKRAD